MKIKWFGQSAFLLTSQQGTVILIDPFGRRFLGYRIPELQADIVAVTHDHRDHNQVQVVQGKVELVNQPEHYTIKDIDIQGTPTFHDNVGGAKRGNNIVFVFTVDGLRICHTGDLGHILTDEQVQSIGKVDVLMLPVGGGGKTLDGAGAAEVMRQLQPTVAIPMHYSTKALGLLGRILFDREDKFLKAAGYPDTEVKELNISQETLEDFRGVVTFQYK